MKYQFMVRKEVFPFLFFLNLSLPISFPLQFSLLVWPSLESQTKRSFATECLAY